MEGDSNSFQHAIQQRRKLKKADLASLEKEELIAKVLQLQAQTEQLQNLVRLKNGNTGNDLDRSKQKKKARKFDFTKYSRRHVFLQIAYLGWDYLGYVTQEHSTKTIEDEIFKALLKTCMIESRETSNYHRCGRTDKGVSAFCQVISIDLRSNLSSGVGVYVPEGYTTQEKTEEIDYVGILNRVLPKEIQVIAWAPVEQQLSSRFDCKMRMYKYFFPKADLDIEAMREAAKHLVGTHDFRNLCKMDVGNGVTNYMRRILNLTIDVPENASCYTMCELTIQGQAFLWHQVRCIVAILFLIGQKKEKPELVRDLLDIEKNPRKPQYSMASEVPLVLFDASYEGVDWIYNSETLKMTIRQLQKIWCNYEVRATMLRRMLSSLEAPPLEGLEVGKLDGNLLIDGVESKVYKPVMKRQTCDSLEERMEHYAKRFKTIETDKMEEPGKTSTSSSQTSVDNVE